METNPANPQEGLSEIKYTIPTRDDGFWDCEIDDGDLEVFKKRDNGSLRPICKMEGPDIGDPGDWGDCAGNFALVCASPAMYKTILETEKLLRFLLKRPSITAGEKTEYISLLTQVKHIVFTLNSFQESIRVEANLEEDE